MTRYIFQPLALAIILFGVFVGFFKATSTRNFDRKSAILMQVQEVFKLSLLEVQVSQIYEVGKDRMRVLSIPIPFTEQQSLIVAEGKAFLGYDLQHTDINIMQKKISIQLPEPMVLSLDIDFRVVFENDYVFNRILPQDRNEMFLKIKSELRSSLLSELRKRHLRNRLEELMKGVLHEFEVQIKGGDWSSPPL